MRSGQLLFISTITKVSTCVLDTHATGAFKPTEEKSPVDRMNTCQLVQLFWELWWKQGHNLPENTHYCYMFELCGPGLGIICNYPEYFLGMWVLTSTNMNRVPWS